MERLTSTKSRQRDSNEYREYRRAVIRESQRKRRALARENGLCGICAKEPVADGYVTCQLCRERMKRWQLQKGVKHG